MNDRRITAANGRVAHDALRGIVAADRFVAGDWARIGCPVADILAAPHGARDRQALFGERFLVLERHDGFAFGRAGRDGYVGYVAETALGPDAVATHWVAAPATHLYPVPDIKTAEDAALSMGARLCINAEIDARFVQTDTGQFALRQHLRELGKVFADPVEVAMRFLGTPYLWGGNSRGGIDCSGLVQMAHLACGRPCPGDTDLQQAGFGQELSPGAALQRGDLLFWKGHVAMVADGRTLIHATAHYMAVVLEPIRTALERISAQGAGNVTGRKRLV